MISTISSGSERIVIRRINVGNLISNTWPIRSGNAVCEAILSALLERFMIIRCIGGEDSLMVDLLAREVPAALEDYGTGTFTEHSLADIRVEERKRRSWDLLL